MDLYGAVTWTLQKVGQKCPENFEEWCGKRLEKISWTNHVTNEEVLRSQKQ